jgi:hypothetical protein
MSSVISFSKNFIFVHVPKTGGTSIFNALVQCTDEIPGIDKLSGVLNDDIRHIIGDRHLRAKDFRFLLGGKYDSMLSFAFVRNPWDKVVSNYYWQFQVRKETAKQPACDFRDFVMHLEQRRNVVSDELWDLECQMPYLTDESGKIIIRKLYRYENIESDFKNICETIGVNCGLPRMRSAYGRRHYREYFNNETREIVRSLFQEDIELFGYEFK